MLSHREWNLNDSSSYNLFSFLEDNQDSLLFTLACNYLSIGQFELARAIIKHLALSNPKKASDLIKCIILYGPPPDWQLSVSVPSSAHLGLLCLTEFYNISTCKNSFPEWIFRQLEFNVILAQILLDCPNENILPNSIKEIRLLYSLINITEDFHELPSTIYIPTLSVLPRNKSLPLLLNRYPSYIIDLKSEISEYNKKLSEYDSGYFQILSKDTVNQLVSITYLLPRLGCSLLNCLKFKFYNIGTKYLENSNLYFTIERITKICRIKMQWIFISCCLKAILSMDTVCNNLESHFYNTIFLYLKNLELQYLEYFTDFLLLQTFNEFSFKHDIDITALKSEEHPAINIVILLVICCIISNFCQIEFGDLIFKLFLSENKDLIVNCMEDAVRFSEKMRYYKKITSLELIKYIVTICKYFQSSIHKCIESIDSSNGEFYRKFMQSFENGKQNCISNILNNVQSEILMEILVICENVWFFHCTENTKVGIFDYSKFLSSTFINPLLNGENSDTFTILSLSKDDYYFWVKYWNWINISQRHALEVPLEIILESNKIYEYTDFNSIFTRLNITNKVLACFPHFRSLAIHLIWSDNLQVNWEILKKLWIPYRLNESMYSCGDMKLNTELDARYTRLAVALWIAENSLEVNSALLDKADEIYTYLSKEHCVIEYLMQINIQNNSMRSFKKWKEFEHLISRFIDVGLLNEEYDKNWFDIRDLLRCYILIYQISLDLSNKCSNRKIVSTLEEASLKIDSLKSSKYLAQFLWCFIILPFYKVDQNNTNDILMDPFLNLDTVSCIIYYLTTWTQNFNGLSIILHVNNEIMCRLSYLLEFKLFTSFVDLSPNFASQDISSHIFSWWFREVLDINFKIDAIDIYPTTKIGSFVELERKRVKNRKVYYNSPWFCRAMNYEVTLGILDLSTEECEDNITSWNMEDLLNNHSLALKLIFINDYEGAIHKIQFLSNDGYTFLPLLFDSIIFQKLLETDFSFPSFYTFHSILEYLNLGHEFSESEFVSVDITQPMEQMDAWLKQFQKICYVDDMEIGWLMRYHPNIYKLYILMDYVISNANTNSYETSNNLLQLSKNIVQKYCEVLDNEYLSTISVTLDRLLIFLESPTIDSLTMYMMEIHTLPLQPSMIRTHLDRMLSKREITSTLVQSLGKITKKNSDDISQLPTEHFTSIIELLKQSINALKDDNTSSNFLLTVLDYIYNILKIIFGPNEHNKIWPILAISPEDIIYHTFFELKLYDESRELAKIMNLDLFTTILSFTPSVSDYLKYYSLSQNASIAEKEFNYIFKDLYSSNLSIFLTAYEIFFFDIDEGYTIWKCALNIISSSLPICFEIIRELLEFRIEKLDILKKINCNATINKQEIFSNSKIPLSIIYDNRNLEYRFLIILAIDYLLRNSEYSEAIKYIQEFISNNFAYDAQMKKHFNLNFLEQVIIQNFIIFVLDRDISIPSLSSDTLHKFVASIKDSKKMFFYITKLWKKWDIELLMDLIELCSRNIKSELLQKSLGEFTDIDVNPNSTLLSKLEYTKICINAYHEISINSNGQWESWKSVLMECETINGIFNILNFAMKKNLFHSASVIIDTILSINHENKVQYNEINGIIKDLLENYLLFFQEKEDIFNSMEISELIEIFKGAIHLGQDIYEISEIRNYSIYKISTSRSLPGWKYSVILFNSLRSIEDKSLIINSLISTHESLNLNQKQLDVLKTISLSLNLLQGLSEEDNNKEIYCPFYVLIKVLKYKRIDLIELVIREAGHASSVQKLFFDYIKSSFGLIGRLDTDYMKTFEAFAIFGSANVEICSEIFPINFKNNSADSKLCVAGIEDYDTQFALNILSKSPKTEVFNFLFEVADQISIKLYNIVKRGHFNRCFTHFCCQHSNPFEMSICSGGTDQNFPEPLSPYSKFKWTKMNLFSKNKDIDLHKDFLAYSFPKKIISFEIKQNTLNNDNFAIFRILWNSLKLLLQWGLVNIGAKRFQIALNGLPFLYDLWAMFPEIPFSIDDITSFKRNNLVEYLLSMDQLDFADIFVRELTKAEAYRICDLPKKHLIKNDNATIDIDESEKMSSARNTYNLVDVRKAISTLLSQFEGDRFNNSKSLINKSINTSLQSRNDIIINIYQKYWEVFCSVEVPKVSWERDGLNFLEISLLTTPSLLNISILNLFIGLASSNIIQKKDSIKHTQDHFLPLKFIIYSFDDVIGSRITELFGQVLLQQKIIPKKLMNTTPIKLPHWINNIVRSKDIIINNEHYAHFNPHTTFLLEHVMKLVKEKALSVFPSNKNHSSKVCCFPQSIMGSFCLQTNVHLVNRYNFISTIVLYGNTHHEFVIKSLARLSCWWEVMVYILRWCFDLCHKSRSVLSENQNSKLRMGPNYAILSFDEIFCNLVVRKAHETNQLMVLRSSISDAIPFGGSRAATIARRCNQIIQKYLAKHGALETLYQILVSNDNLGDQPHALAGALAVHLSQVNHIELDARIGYLEAATDHFSSALCSLRRRSKSIITTKNKKNNSLFLKKESDLSTKNRPNINNIFISKIMITSICDINVSKINLTSWGGLSSSCISRILGLIGLQTSIIKTLPRISAKSSILSPFYDHRKDTIVEIFLNGEFGLGFRSIRMLELPPLELLTLVTKYHISNKDRHMDLLEFIDKMKNWIPESDLDTLIVDTINNWIFEKETTNRRKVEEMPYMALIDRICNSTCKEQIKIFIQKIKDDTFE
ncbi:uncharacterized protein CMU_007760 [Cryptosporidium muris RN66]|uniref:Uncharacterized protein n=1 Tax=Cryptosporidium muris (strain RN66) TaxID=441375 RepID=B6ADJ5_CRYMR|nr:uncharacterized protein CMU_007760 [Cryptosporidium muris RN66]EEA06286.1 hypothetical protein CMU_007760 [Cryptosporidium muris RN66]|eukprot:XP_002140635.1 hypothetical protein [Cryptosporidium muris RN66]